GWNLIATALPEVLYAVSSPAYAGGICAPGNEVVCDHRTTGSSKSNAKRPRSAVSRSAWQNANRHRPPRLSRRSPHEQEHRSEKGSPEEAGEDAHGETGGQAGKESQATLKARGTRASAGLARNAVLRRARA